MTICGLLASAPVEDHIISVEESFGCVFCMYLFVVKCKSPYYIYMCYVWTIWKDFFYMKYGANLWL